VENQSSGKCLFFGWLVLLGRCWTLVVATPWSTEQWALCLCSQEMERFDHLILTCIYSREFWYLILAKVGWSHIAPVATDTFVYWWLGAPKRVSKEHRKAFDSIVILVAWCLWVQRNDSLQ
jgi:hypothetical protein